MCKYVCVSVIMLVKEEKNPSKEKVADSAPHNCHMKWLHIFGQILGETIKTKTKKKVIKKFMKLEEEIEEENKLW